MDDALTSSFLRKRGSCCKSGCLHCPYGFTLRKYGLKLFKLCESNKVVAQPIFDTYFKKDTTVSSLLGSAFKAPKTTSFNGDNFRVLSLKDVICGLVEIDNDQFKNLYLAESFKDQGISDTQVMANCFPLN